MQSEIRTIGQLARDAGVRVETVRYYERRGLLPRARRSPAGYRLFDDEALRRIRFVKRAQALGFSLREVHELLSLRTAKRVDCDAVRERAARKIADVEEKIRALQAIRKVLLQLVDKCESRRTSDRDCPILGSLDWMEGH